MTRKQKRVQNILEGKGDVPFRDFERVTREFGFVLDRVSGSHHIYVHPRVTRPLNVQPLAGLVKRYQLRQFRAMVSEFNLLPDEA